MIKVLIVEDDPMVREINEKFLKKVEGYSLYDSVNSIEKAKESILTGDPDLILLDIFFPQGKGLELLKWIRSGNIKCDVILITADRSIETVEEAFRYGVVDYLVKPFVFKRFNEAMIQYKNRKNSFRSTESVEQDLIDRYTLKERRLQSSKKDDISEIKGFSQHTYEKVLQGIEDMRGETFTSQQLAKKIGISRITARRYLDYLEKEKKLVIELEYGKVGRPKNNYRLKDE
ncbi:response regulator [Wukongibacter sp. M2B1]|uniref:response regulator n=1 Tax=Wukongibacter sp. M2B1 TaxID=3088895 RepID=UPI003D78E3BF